MNRVFTIFLLIFCISLFIGLNLVESIGLAFFCYVVSDLLGSLGKKIPFMELTGSILSFQLFFSPFLDYHLFHNEVFGIMQVDSISYFSYVVPCLIVSYIALKLAVGNSEIKFTENVLNTFSNNSNYFRRMGQRFLVFGYLFYLILLFEIPLSLGFLLVLFAYFRFIGFLLLWLSGSKYTLIYFLIVFVPFTIQVLYDTIFIDLIVWAIILFSIYVIKNKVNYFITLPLIAFSFFCIVIFQSVKMTYRMHIWYGNEENTTLSNVSLLTNLIYDQLKDLDSEKLKIIGGAVNVRFNQGWIVSEVIDNIPRNVNHSKWYFLGKELKGILLPRILYPNKLATDNNEKFNLYVGYQLEEGVAMDLSIPGDGYGAFGRMGGIIFCAIVYFIYGLFYRMTNKFFWKYPEILLLNITIFFYVFRAGNEFYIITNWMVKSGLLILGLLFVLNNKSINKTLFKPLQYSI